MANELLGDDIRFVGLDVGPRPFSARIRTTQPDIVGESPAWASVHAWLRRFGFANEPHLRLGAYDALSCSRGDIWLFDVRPMNFVQTSDDTLVPIDLIVQRRR